MSVATAAENEQRDDEHPDPVIAEEMAQTAVIHKSTSVVECRKKPEASPALSSYDGCGDLLPLFVECPFIVAQRHSR
jgi:hypothetical protein